jgi:transcriptional regulator with XRE-family HTH domain
MSRSERAAVNRRRLRSALRGLRSESKQTQREVAEALDWSPSKLMRIEGGQVGVSATDVKALLDHYGVKDQGAINALQDMAKRSRTRAHSSQYVEDLSREFLDFLDQEEAAAIVRQYENNWLPGPLQTAEYARAVIRNAFLDPPERLHEIVEARVLARVGRGQLLVEGDGPEAFFIVDESALWRRVGSTPDSNMVMIRQLEHLKSMARHPNITIQVVPFGLGAYHALRTPFELLEFDDATDGHLLYRESPDGQLLVRDDSRATAPYLDEFLRLERLATPPAAIERCVDFALEVHRRGGAGLAQLQTV